MAVDNTLSPHGGELKVSVAGHGDAGHSPNGLPRLPVRDQLAREIVNLSYGFFSPLNGFMTSSDHDAVCAKMRLADGTLWPVPITLDVSEATADKLSTGSCLALRDAEGVMLAVLHVEDIWRPDRKAEAESRATVCLIPRMVAE